MRKLLQISIEVNANSVGKIAEQIGEVAINQGWDSYITYARDNRPSKSKVLKIGNKFGIYWHGVMTRLFDRHCLHSTNATKKLIKQIKEIDPDVILLHHIHGYYLNMRELFAYLKLADKPVVWVFHDCWSFTGHCAHFYDINSLVECNKWQIQCFNCQLKGDYPGSMLIDRSKKNFILKKELFTSVKNLTIVPVSDWLANLTRQSFLRNQRIERIYNGIDLQIFVPQSSKDIYDKYGIPVNADFIIGVASTWDKLKGLDDFYILRSLLPKEVVIVLVGLTAEQIKALPPGIIGINRTYNVQEMAALYSAASVFVNPTYSDTLPTVNIEAQACGTPVITYRTGGCPETIDDGVTGLVVERGDKDAMAKSILYVLNYWDLSQTSMECRKRAEMLYDKRKNFNIYLDLFNRILNL